MNNNLKINQQEKENFAHTNSNIINEIEDSQINGEDKRQNFILENKIINGDFKK